VNQSICLPEGNHDPAVYFIRLGNCVKIGHTTHVRRRVCDLSLRTDFIVLFMPGDRSLESSLHRQFSRERLGGTEWFRYSTRISSYVSQSRKTPPDTYVDRAQAVVQETRIASASLLQRELRIGFKRAQSLMNELEVRGVVGQLEGPGCSRPVIQDEHLT
jgi:Ftsk gamma domain/T5orf172 domain